MANINELLARAAALRDETQLNSISPERAGGIMYDTLLAMNELWLQQGAALVISKIYASVATMEADTAPISDLTGLPLRPGQIVVIASSDSDNGSVYRYNGTSSPSWSLVGEIGNLEPVDSLDSDSTSLPLAAHQGKVLDGKISQLGQDVDKYSVTLENTSSGGDWIEDDYALFSGGAYNLKATGTITACQIYDGSWHAISGVTFPVANKTVSFISEYNATKIKVYAAAGATAIISKKSKIWDTIDEDIKNLSIFKNHIYNVTERNDNASYDGIAQAAATITYVGDRFPGMIVIFRVTGSNTNWKAYLYSSTNVADSAFYDASNWKELSVTLNDVGGYYKFVAKTIFNVSLNESKYNYTSLSEAVQDIALTDREKGMIISYATANTEWHLALYNSTNLSDEYFYNDENWLILKTYSDNGVRRVVIGEDYSHNEFKKISTISNSGSSLDTETYFNRPNVVRKILLSDIIDTSVHTIKKIYIGFECKIDGDVYDGSIENLTGVGGKKLCPAFAVKLANKNQLMAGFRAEPISNPLNPHVSNETLPAISSDVMFVGANTNFYGAEANYDDNEMPMLKLDDAFAIRWIGATSADVMMKSESGELTIYTAGGTLYSFSYTTYPTIKELVAAINAESDLSAKVLNDVATSEIHDFSEIYLLKDVSLTNTSDVVVSTSRYNPYVIVKTNRADVWHKIEIIKDTDVNDRWYVFVDGVSFQQYSWAATTGLNNALEFYFGGTANGTNLSYYTRNYDIRINDLLDAEIHTKQAGGSSSTDGGFLLSNEHKYVLFLVGHGIAESGSMTRPLSFFETMFQKLKEAGFVPLDIHQVQNYVNGITKDIPKRAYAICYDDSRFNIVLDKDTMAMHARFGVRPCNGVIPESGPTYSFNGETYQYKDLCDWSNILRAYPIGHTGVCLTEKTVDELIQFFGEYQDFGRTMHFNTSIYVVAYGKTNLAVKNIQKLFGIELSINTSGRQGYVVPALNKYSIQRIQADTSFPVDGYII